MSKFKVYYDDQPDSAVWRIDACLEDYGLEIVDLSEDGKDYCEYEIVEIQYEED